MYDYYSAVLSWAINDKSCGKKAYKLKYTDRTKTCKLTLCKPTLCATSNACNTVAVSQSAEREGVHIVRLISNR